MDRTSGVLHQPDRPFQGGTLRLRQLPLLALGPLLRGVEVRLYSRDTLLEFLDAGVQIVHTHESVDAAFFLAPLCGAGLFLEDGDLTLQFGVLVCQGFDRSFQRACFRLQRGHPLVDGGTVVLNGARKQGGGHQDADRCPT